MSGLAVRLLCASAEGAEVERRFGEWVSRWPAKQVARRFDASPRTVKAWRKGALPQATTLTAMVGVWGIGFLEFIFAPVLAQSDLDVQRRLDRLQSDITALKDAIHEYPAHLREAAGEVASPARGAVRAVGRAMACAIAGALILAAALQQIAPQGPGQDMARLRHAPVRVVRVASSSRTGGGRDGIA